MDPHSTTDIRADDRRGNKAVFHFPNGGGTDTGSDSRVRIGSITHKNIPGNLEIVVSHLENLVIQLIKNFIIGEYMKVSMGSSISAVIISMVFYRFGGYQPLSPLFCGCSA